ncbi:symmetrical bis(5'-nucleosyl)-tetraphosphatase [Alginatibacterium sediminis]|uniref:Bis(5'-nucleosyl)-tetraphosphatase, symmetrical n=1 Tax=Alginatibacterium sediminis TaxID=2164068 RepID=A0A420E7V7_9ALTE|nr:symmetrical bis(5'-nucleosyl)-tetraphosphatase [Alginatibacterium sediminis]RKF14538.1 symmetrical bis(5'-nucleosyl)-tetraphosphatase [Alginatibacterium sediminis]
MATYFVGDIQGCYQELSSLLKMVRFDKKYDQLWCAGDLVARGPQSLETLRFIKSLGSSAQVVLGNHDLHLLAIANGIKRNKARDHLTPILEASDKDELLDWLRCQALVKQHPDFNVVMVHAGISPQWSVDTAISRAKEVETILRSDHYLRLLQSMYGNEPAHWNKHLEGLDRWRYIINACTRMRYCFADGTLDFELKIPPQQNDNPNLKPWYEIGDKHLQKQTIVFGHWAALEGRTSKDKVIATDTGCVWGNRLSMLRWEDQRWFNTPSQSQY